VLLLIIFKKAATLNGPKSLKYRNPMKLAVVEQKILSIKLFQKNGRAYVNEQSKFFYILILIDINYLSYTCT
jgi:hypothetical protein